jgi:hypothetical protein
MPVPATALLCGLKGHARIPTEHILGPDLHGGSFVRTASCSER